MKRRRRKRRCRPFDLPLSAAEVELLVSVRDAVTLFDHELAERRTLARLVLRRLLWRCHGEIGLTWDGMACCGRVLDPITRLQ